ncbi:glycosyl transferase family 1 [Synechococcus sp. CS-1329]|uniref:glycosyltransferase n=1 Tax=Synechococcus sp. CS-1329 TaxID=2847975 RepID=UPI00223BC367|nr:glycosyltransferase [Synechococcus sp. CS-1329]MCT0218879.1 glycosyl transferase family 1 [Synechococcus sp. CS-1329]
MTGFGAPGKGETFGQEFSSKESVIPRPRNILFIHGNYPGQFRNIASLCGADPAFRVAYLTEHDHPNKWQIKGVRVHTYQRRRRAHSGTHMYVRCVEDSVLTGQAVLRSLHTLLKSGFQPDVVVFHAGSGLGLFLRDLLPKAKLIGYFEWYFHASTSRYLFAKFELDQQLGVGIRNLPIEHELLLADHCIVPTQWQFSQFPLLLQQKLSVLFDGIDTRFFHPRPAGPIAPLHLPLTERTEELVIEPSDSLLTYATRGMEPLRGFPEFMRFLPHLLGKNPNLKVVIAGDDRQAYSYAAPSHEGSWKRKLMHELGLFPGSERIFFCGSLPYQRYRELLWRSDLHCYFTRPYVTSWSLFEAVACKTPLCINLNGATELFRDRAHVVVDLDAPSSIQAAAIDQALAQPDVLQDVSAEFPVQFRLESCMSRWRRLLLEA